MIEWGHCVVCGVCIFFLSDWVLSGHSGFLPQFRDVHRVWLTSDCQLPGLEYMSVSICQFSNRLATGPGCILPPATCQLGHAPAPQRPSTGEAEKMESTVVQYTNYCNEIKSIIFFRWNVGDHNATEYKCREWNLCDHPLLL